MTKEKEALVRVNTRISSELNNWLDNESAKTGLSKSSIMMIATENYRREKDTFSMMADIGQLVNMLGGLDDRLESIEMIVANSEDVNLNASDNLEGSGE